MYKHFNKKPYELSLTPIMTRGLGAMSVCKKIIIYANFLKIYVNTESSFNMFV